MATKQTLIVVKANGLLKSSYRLSVDEQRLILGCIAQIQPGEVITDQTMYTISAQEIADLAGFESRTTVYARIAAAADRLWRREVCIKTEPDGTTQRPEELMTRWVQSCKYSKNEGVVKLRFAHDMLPYLTQLTGSFTQFKLAEISKLATGYSMRLYELLMQWNGRGTREIAVDDLRDMMAVDEGKYPRLIDLKRYVIDRAVKDINKNTNMLVSYGQRKRGRVIVALQFEFHEKPKATPKAKKLAGKKKLSDAEIRAAARPGESWQAAITRLKNLDMFAADRA